MKPKPFALLNHFTFPLIRDTFLTPGGRWKHDHAVVPADRFFFSWFCHCYWEGRDTPEIDLLPMTCTPYTRYFGFGFILRFTTQAVN